MYALRIYKEYYWLKIYSPEISHGFRNFEIATHG